MVSELSLTFMWKVGNISQWIVLSKCALLPWLGEMVVLVDNWQEGMMCVANGSMKA